MSTAAVKIKIMPTSPDANLKQIEDSAKKIIEDIGGKNPTFVEEEIAFGLKAIIVLFAWPEEKELEDLEAELQNIEDVNSIQMIDIRRAFGS
jgi:translation elongation factor aEF-1 beta